MEQLKQLLINLERISFQDLSEIPEERQHEVAEQLEQLQDSLSTLSQLKKFDQNFLVLSRDSYVFTIAKGND